MHPKPTRLRKCAVTLFAALLAVTVAELDAGLNIIAEWITFPGTQFNAGTMDRQNIIRTGRGFEEAVRARNRELRKYSSRIGLL